MVDKIIQIMKNNYTLPSVLLSNYKNLKINEKDLIILIYLINEKDFTFNPKKISESLNMSLPDIMESIDNLTTNDLVQIELRKTNEIREEFINIDNLYTKLAYFVVNEEEVKEPSHKTNIYDIFEREFARTLSPIEYELINGWIEAGFVEDVIVLALKEAVYNGVSNLRYIDKILYEWKKKGLNSKEAVEGNRNRFQQVKVEKKELFDYDWLNDND